MTDGQGSVVVATRPTPGHPRPYHFPPFERATLPNGLTVLTVHLPGRPLISAQLVYRNGAADEPAAEAGATVLSARALTEGTERYDAIALIEATERLGASLHADASWDAYTVGIEVPGSRLEAAFELLAEVVAHPTFPEAEVERIRDERLNDILQARADARRRVDEAFAATIYRDSSPYHRPSGGIRATVAQLDRETLERAWRRGLDPARTALVVAGDLEGIDPVGLADRLMAGWAAAPGAVEPGPIDARSTAGGRRIRLVDKPGAPQSEIRVGHVGPAPADPRLPRAVRPRGDPRRAVQLAAQHEAPRGEGLHLRSPCRVRPPPVGGPVLGPGRGQHRGHGRRVERPGDRARADPLRARHRRRAPGGPRLPHRGVPAPVRDARSRSSRPSRGCSSTTCPTTSSPPTASGSTR